MSTFGSRGGRFAVASIVLAAALIAAPGIVAGNGIDVAPDIAVKAPFLHNFARFAEWPELRSSTPINVCIVGDDRIGASFVETVRGQRIDDHTLGLRRPQDSAAWRVCNPLCSSQRPRLDERPTDWPGSGRCRF